MEEKNEKVLFDPGYAPLVIESIGQTGYTYYMFSAIRDVKIKKMNFLGVSLKLEKLLKINAAFYLGCLLWATYIKSHKNAQIEGNQLLGEECSEEEYTTEIDFLIDFIQDNFPRDYKYFKNKVYEPDKRYLPIFKTYRDFLVLNKGFVKTQKTDEIILPKNIKNVSQQDLEKIYNKVMQVINSQNMELAFDCYDIIL